MRPIIPDSEFKERVAKIQALMARDGYDMLLCYGNEAEPQYVRYLSDYWPSFETAGVIVPPEGEAFLLIGPESRTFATDRSRLPQIRLLKAFRESSEPEYPGKPLDTFKSVFDELIGNRQIKKFGVAGMPLMTLFVHSELCDALEAHGCIPEKADDLVNSLRMIKTENELACMREAGRITRLTMDYVIANIHPGMTECQVAGLGLAEMHRCGAERESYAPWVLTGDGSNQAISRPRQKVIKAGDMTFLQFGARYEGYASTIGRSVVYGQATQQQRSLIEAGYELQERVLDTISAGVPAAEVARVHKETAYRLGYGEWLLYGPCHGNGLMEGEAPWIESNSTYDLEENMTFCACIFLGNTETKIGLRVEDVFRVTKGGHENLTAYPKELFVV